MKATDLLEKQHHGLELLFERLEKAKVETERNQLFEELAADLAAHDAIERELFYPACEVHMGVTDLLGEALVEHGVIEFSLYLANEALGEDDFGFKLKVLREMVEHHVEEESEELFPKVEKALGATVLEELGGRMRVRFEELRAADFRAPLRENLRQVLAGTLEPTTNGAKPPPSRRTPAKRASKAARSHH